LGVKAVVGSKGPLSRYLGKDRLVLKLGVFSPILSEKQSQGVTMAIALTEKAATEIKKIVKDQGLPVEQTRLRIGVKGGGCSGFSYMLDLTEEPKGESDEELDSHGVKILIDMKSNLYLDGTEIDFKDEVMAKGFVFKNPNATSTCGCGSSFQA
jgi:iron-sulfur cluster assembly protein